MKRAHEVGEIAETDGERDVRDGPRGTRQEARGAVEPGADDVTDAGHAEDPAEDAKKVKGAEARLSRRRAWTSFVPELRGAPQVPAGQRAVGPPARAHLGEGLR